MYAEHFGLTADPFSLTPDPAFLYLSPDHREALAAVQYGLLDGRGFITLIGEVGTGKTTLLYSILGRRHPGLEAAYVSYSAQRFEDLLASALKDLKIDTTGMSKPQLLEALNQLLVQRADEDRTTALIIDEAQNLSDESFEELRLLSNFETYTRKLLQIVLVGQPELQERLRQPGLRQLRERVSVRAYVNPLSRDEMAKYIAHRLQRAGGAVEKLFTPRALRILVRRTGGVPRRANILCHNALLFAFGRNLQHVTHVEAREAIAEMDERRPGRMPRRALRRVPFQPHAWRWAAALGGAVAVGIVASQLWSISAPSRTAPAVPRAEGDVVAPSPGDAVAATKAPEPAPAPPAVPAPAEAAVAEPAPSGPPPTPEAPPAAPKPSEPAANVSRPRAEMSIDSLSVVVPRGAALWGLLRDVYGDRFAELDRPALYDRVRELNPHVTDVNVIIAGDRLRLPLPPRAPVAPEETP
jgi:general secretion pathway protein A